MTENQTFLAVTRINGSSASRQQRRTASEQAAWGVVLRRVAGAPRGSSVALWIYGPDNGTGGRALVAHYVLRGGS